MLVGQRRCVASASDDVNATSDAAVLVGRLEMLTAGGVGVSASRVEDCRDANGERRVRDDPEPSGDRSPRM
jgi:hypothetical protein